MSKVKLVAHIQKTLGAETRKAEAERTISTVIDGVKADVKKSKSVQLFGFGTFKIVSRKARKGIHPKTGASIKIKPSR